jgi:hypothetical protein
MNNGTITKLIQLFEDYENNENIHENIAQSISCLFKSLPLPPEIRKYIIEELKREEYLERINFDELALVAECPGI